MKINQRRGKKKRKTKERGLPNKKRVLVPNFKEAKMIRAQGVMNRQISSKHVLVWSMALNAFMNRLLS